jgi:hypothetical protein
MKLKKEYLILGGIIAVLLIYLILGSGRNKMSYKVPELQDIQTGEINRIEINRSGISIILAGKEDNWKIVPQEYIADSTKVNSMLDVVENLTLTELAAEKKDFQRYGLDEENKITVKAYKGDTLLRQFDIGKTSSTYNHTFVKLENDSRIFYARTSFKSDFSYEVGELRDKVIMDFEQSEITGIEIQKSGKSLQFVKKMETVELEEKESQAANEALEAPGEARQEETWVLPDGTKGNKDNINSILSAISSLRCDEYIEGKNKEDFKEPVYTVILKGTKDYTLKIFEKEDKENGKYPSFSSENAYPFLLSTYSAESIMKKPEELI